MRNYNMKYQENILTIVIIVIKITIKGADRKWSDSREENLWCVCRWDEGKKGRGQKVRWGGQSGKEAKAERRRMR